MSANTLTDITTGDIITATHKNEIHSAFNGDFVGRNSSGAPTSGQNLGTASIPWGTLRANALVVGGSSVDTSQVATPPFRVVSGATRSGASQALYITPAGTSGGLSATVEGTPTPLSFDVNGTSYTLSADLTVSSLTAAPSTNNTCLVNDTNAADQAATRIWGEENPYSQNKEITIDTVGTEISSRDGELAAFQLSSEIFLARIDTTNNRLHKCRRGYFFNSSGNPIQRETLANNDTITLLSLGYLFLDSDLTTVDVTYNEPFYGFTEPSSPATGDYWYDTEDNLWMRYNGSAFVSVTRTFIGLVAINTADCIGARAQQFDVRFKDDNTLDLEIFSTEVIQASSFGAKVNVNGTEINFGSTRPQWNITTDRAASTDMYSATEQSSTYYGAYLSDEGEEIFSDIEPMHFPEYGGLYHPFNMWRFVGEAFNNSSSQITLAQSESNPICYIRDSVGNGHDTSTFRRRFTTTDFQVGTIITRADTAGDGTSYTLRRDCKLIVNYTDERSGGTAQIGITANETTGTNIASLTAASGVKLIEGQIAVAGQRGHCSWGGDLPAGTRIGANTDSGPDTTDDDTQFSINILYQEK